MKLTRRAFAVAAGSLAVAGIAALAGCSSEKKEEEKKDEPKEEPAKEEPAEDGYTLLKEGKIVFATSPDYPPFESLEDDEYVGYDMDLGRAIAEKMGLECEFVTIQFDGIIPAIVAGGQADAAISGFTVDPERAKDIDFTDAYYIDDQAIVVAGDSELTAENIDEKLDDEAVVIAAQSGTTGESYAKENYPKATVKGYGNATDSFAALQAGQAQAVVTNLAVAEAEVAGSFTECQIVKKVATGEEYAVVVSKDNPGLTAAINAAIVELFEDGTVNSIAAKHLG